MNPTSQWLKGTFCPDDSSGQGKEQYISILKPAHQWDGTNYRAIPFSTEGLGLLRIAASLSQTQQNRK